MRSNIVLAGLVVCSITHAVIPGNKRTILTSGEKVYPIRYQLGQSTVVDLGIKPEVVICGNKNYFNIEKLKTGITIQPLSNFSTNLTVLGGNRRFLFYLVPSGGQAPDGFIDVKWIPPGQTKLIKTKLARSDTQVDLNQKVKIGSHFLIELLRVKSNSNGRKIFDLSIKNESSKPLELRTVGVIAFEGSHIVSHQALAWENEILEKNSTILGRLITTNAKSKNLAMVIKVGGETIKLKVKGF